MTLPISAAEEVKKKFLPKRRAPYLLQNEIIQRALSSTSLPSLKSSENKFSEELLDTHHKQKKQKVKLVVNKGSKKKSISSQLGVEFNLNYHEEVSKLYGIQKRVAHYFVNCCITRRDTTTGSITAETLCSVTNTTKKTLKKILQRMIEKKLIERINGKRGKGGFSIFRLDKAFINVVRLQLDLENNHLSAMQKHNISLKAQTSTPASNLPQEWQSIDFSAIKEMGFGIPQLRQLYNKSITTPETVQSSINHFAFVLENRPEKLKKYNDKLATFMSVLNKGGAWVEQDYMSPKEIAFKKIAEQKKERIEKLKKMEEEFFKSEFELWESSLTEEQKNKIVPVDAKNSTNVMDRIGRILALKNYFKQNLWQKKMPDELKQIKKELEI